MPAEITYLYSFLLKPFSFGVIRESRDDYAIFRERLVQHFEDARGIQLDRQEHIIHLSEEEVPPQARLPLYHKFPHLSLDYSLGAGYFGRFSRDHDGLASLTKTGHCRLKVSLFVFDSGAGMLSLRLYPLERDGGVRDLPTRLERIEEYFRAAEFHYPNVFLDADCSSHPFGVHLCEGAEKILCEYPTAKTLQEFFRQELDKFLETLRSIGSSLQGDSNRRKAPRKARWSRGSAPQLPVEPAQAETPQRAYVERAWRLLSDATSLDTVMTVSLAEGVGGERGYVQRPFVIALLPYRLPKSIPLVWIARVLREETGSIGVNVNLRDLGLEADVRCLAGANGAVVIIDKRATQSTQRQALGIVYRVLGSVRILWHSMTVMNTYMGRCLTQINTTIRLIEAGKIGKSRQEREKLLIATREDAAQFSTGFYAFLTGDDPVAHSVHFASYGRMFRDASAGYDYVGIRQELWEKLRSLEHERLTLQRVLDRVILGSPRRGGMGIGRLVFFVTGLLTASGGVLYWNLWAGELIDFVFSGFACTVGVGIAILVAWKS